MGIVYLIQPAEFAGTERYKVGCSDKSDTSRVTLGYHKGTTLRIAEMVQDPFEIERTLVKRFAERFRCFLGREYFEGDVAQMERCFKDVTAEFKHPNDHDELTEEDQARFRCGKCRKVLSSKQVLTYHEWICNGLDSKQCEICLKIFSSRYGKYKHKKNVKCSPPDAVPVQ